MIKFTHTEKRQTGFGNQDAVIEITVNQQGLMLEEVLEYCAQFIRAMGYRPSERSSLEFVEWDNESREMKDND